MGGGAKLSSGGSATVTNVIARYNTVQEGSGTGWAYAGWTAALFPPQTAVSPVPVVDAAFTVFGQPAGGRHLNGPGVGTYTFRDCQFGGGEISFDSLGVGSVGISLTLKNCLLEGVLCSLTSHTAPATLSLWNCLLWHGHATFAAGTQGAFSVYDTLFDQTAIGQSGMIAHGYNGYVADQNRLTPTQSTDKVLSASPAYQTGQLGKYYQPATALINGGSRSAAAAGLYHYTVKADNTKEGTDTPATVDIGFHYVACANGLPVDTDGDTLPDYVEDEDGDGSRDANESDIAQVDTDYDGVRDGDEVAEGADAASAICVVPRRLSHWTFDGTEWKRGDQGQQPMAENSISASGSFDGTALSLDGAGSFLKYRHAESGGVPNLNLQRGSIRVWFRPNWAFASAPHGGRLIEVGQYPNGWWGLYFHNSDGHPRMRLGSRLSAQTGSDDLLDMGLDYVYRSVAGLDGFGAPLEGGGTSQAVFVDPGAASFPVLYQVRACRRVVTGGGSYYDLSQGRFFEVQ